MIHLVLFIAIGITHVALATAGRLLWIPRNPGGSILFRIQLILAANKEDDYETGLVYHFSSLELVFTTLGWSPW